MKYSYLGLSLCMALAGCGGSGGGAEGQGPQAASAPVVSLAASMAKPDGTGTVAKPAEYEPEVRSLAALAPFPVGVAVSYGTESYSLSASPAQQSVVRRHFSQLTAGNIMKMSYLHPEENTFTFAQADELLKFASDNGMNVHGHALIWHADYQVPRFMRNYTGDKQGFLDLLKTHVQTIAGHYSGRVASWDVVNEAINDWGGYRNSVFYQKTGTDYIEQAFINARAADPVADLYYNDYNIEASAPKLQTMVEMLDGFRARAVPISGVGFQMHVYMDYPSISSIRAAFKAVVDRNLKVKITELDIPINNPYSPTYQSGDVKTEYTLALGLAQKKRYCEVVKAYMDTVPPHLRGGVSVWGVNDPSSWLIQQLFQGRHADWPLLFDSEYVPKPALRGVADALTGQPCTNT